MNPAPYQLNNRFAQSTNVVSLSKPERLYMCATVLLDEGGFITFIPCEIL